MPVEPKVSMIKFASSSAAYNGEKALEKRAQRMIEQTAVVVSVDSGHAWILPQQKSGDAVVVQLKPPVPHLLPLIS
ncbi:hypothetical protein [Thiothrix subterranea]|uniref:hypothetical protein n=1 Tax=Thiothrix subterranea TaxID=2735563 RepID=UPI00280AD9FA|nr:hypothetical protein [Thiothrix subterranea]